MISRYICDRKTSIRIKRIAIIIGFAYVIYKIEIFTSSFKEQWHHNCSTFSCSEHCCIFLYCYTVQESYLKLSNTEVVAI